MKNHLKMTPYLLVNAIAFYILPMVIQDTGSAMAVMLIALPVICFLTSLSFGFKNAFQWMYPLMTALLFAPTIFLFYNQSASIYIAVYGVIALAGNLIGTMLRKRTK